MQRQTEHNCPNCNQIIPHSNRFFCPHCGFNLQTIYKGYSKPAAVLLILFPPAGLYLMWKKTVWDGFIKIVLSILFTAVFIFEGYFLASFIKSKVNPVDIKHTTTPQITEVNNSTSTTSELHVVVTAEPITTTTTTTTVATASTTTKKSEQSITRKTTKPTSKSTVKQTIKTTKKTTRATTKSNVKPTSKTTTRTTAKATTNSTVRPTVQATTKPTTRVTTMSTSKSTIPGTAISVQQAAVIIAKDYLNSCIQSRTELIRRLMKYGFSYKDAVYGADNCGADWG